jgi:hypothetical protein
MRVGNKSFEMQQTSNKFCIQITGKDAEAGKSKLDVRRNQEQTEVRECHLLFGKKTFPFPFAI